MLPRADQYHAHAAPSSLSADAARRTPSGREARGRRRIDVLSQKHPSTRKRRCSATSRFFDDCALRFGRPRSHSAASTRWRTTSPTSPAAGGGGVCRGSEQVGAVGFWRWIWGAGVHRKKARSCQQPFHGLCIAWATLSSTQPRRMGDLPYSGDTRQAPGRGPRSMATNLRRLNKMVAPGTQVPVGPFGNIILHHRLVHAIKMACGFPLSRALFLHQRLGTATRDHRSAIFGGPGSCPSHTTGGLGALPSGGLSR